LITGAADPFKRGAAIADVPVRRVVLHNYAATFGTEAPSGLSIMLPGRRALLSSRELVSIFFDIGHIWYFPLLSDFVTTGLDQFRILLNLIMVEYDDEGQITILQVNHDCDRAAAD
jgi:hypothetical protein